MKKTYNEILQEYLASQIIREMDITKTGNVCYLAHFAVVKCDRETTKVRPVFDGASQHEYICLNDTIADYPISNLN